MHSLDRNSIRRGTAAGFNLRMAPYLHFSSRSRTFRMSDHVLRVNGETTKSGVKKHKSRFFPPHDLPTAKILRLFNDAASTDFRKG